MSVSIKSSWIFRGKIVLGYTEAELRVRGSGYQFIHAADMLYCAENHVRSKSQLFAACMVYITVNTNFSEIPVTHCCFSKLTQDE